MMKCRASHRQAPVTASGGARLPASTGFTLIEMLVTVSLIAILAALAAPSFDAIMLNNKLSSAATRLAASAVLARSEAIKRNLSVTVCVSVDSASCAASGTWEQGWIVLAGSTVIHVEQALPAGLVVSDTLAGKKSLSFASTGVGSDQASFTICRKTPSVGDQERVVTVSATGSTSVKKTVTGSCP